MNIQPSIDLKKVNLQTAVGYLVSLHENEYQWNLLGVKVIGVAPTEADIPEGTYEYGDAYEVGTEPPYNLYIFTRPDGKVHTEGYWFNTGKFPMPGPKGDKGDGLEQVNKWTNGTVSGVTYDTTNGAKVTQITTVDYTDSTDGSTKQHQFGTTTTLPIVPGKYISMNGTSDNKKMEVKVDDTALALDYIKIDKTSFNYVPWWYDGTLRQLSASTGADGGLLAVRLPDGQLRMSECMADAFSTTSGNNKVDFYAIYNNTVGTEYSIDKTSTDTGTLTTTQLSQLYGTVQSNNRRIIYDGQAYIRMDPTNAPDGTLNYIHLDSIEDGNGGYKATGKCFSVTISTRAWKVFDLDFGGKVYKHAIHFTLTGAGTSSTANLWDIDLVITTSSPNQITKDTLYKYISTNNYPLQGGTPISVYRERVQGPQGMGIGRMAVHHEVGEISNTDHYIFELMSMDGISETITERDQNSLSSFVDTVTEV